MTNTEDQVKAPFRDLFSDESEEESIHHPKKPIVSPTFKQF